ncbi:hypothetical protein [Polyangium sp. 15x6]|uniref:hypothetical protein n=1 Tax=Polyangium sp. 15x6 TaxID=3042687 RepID=UPI00249B32DB|nr:hypothetical protein [Polyangium sp. 15x6]MDI3290078.1 hypothetical protein [Polyangium sp. 15x6]
MRRTSWSDLAPRTLWSPVESPADAVRAFERKLQALYRAHLAVLTMALVEPPPSEPELVRMTRALRAVVHFYQGWPILEEAERTRLSETALREAPVSFLFGRPDIVMGEEGPQVAETNFDTAVSGYEKPDDLWTQSAELFELPSALLQSGRPLAGLKDYFTELAEARPHRIHWVRSAAAAPECEPILAYLNQNPHGIQHFAHYAGEPSPSYSPALPGHIHRACSLYTVNKARDAFTDTLRPLVPTVAGSTVPLRLAALQSKLLLACLSDPRTRPRNLTPEEQDAVGTLIPETRLLDLMSGAELDHVRRNRGDFILKRADSHMGRHVFFGCAVEQDEWEHWLRELPAQPAERGEPPSLWLVQRRVRPREYTLLEFTDEGPVERRAALVCSPYLFGGRLRGFETWRVPFVPEPDMLNQATFVGHFLRSAE